MPYKNGGGARGCHSCSPFAIIVSYFVVTSAAGVRWSGLIIRLYSRILLGAFLFEDFDDPAAVYLDVVAHGKREKTAGPFFSAEIAQFVLDVPTFENDPATEAVVAGQWRVGSHRLHDAWKDELAPVFLQYGNDFFQAKMEKEEQEEDVWSTIENKGFKCCCRRA